MKNFYRCFITLFCVFALINESNSQTKDGNTTLSTQGRDFWLAVPLNDAKSQPILELEFYVTSSYNTLVSVEVPGTGFLRSKKLNANEVVIFSTKDGSATFDFEIVSSQIPDPHGIHIYADQPISVTMMNSKQVTSDGYLALPVSAWGTDYIHCAYYDYGEFRPWGAGFIVIASEDNTEVTINLKGVGSTLGKTRSGSKIGDIVGPIKLNKGEVYNVVGDGTSVGVFDLSGSRITANKPIGLISYHERTMLPSNNTNGRDHLCEMLPPISSWGKKYCSIELQRDGKGDFYRAVSSQPNTKVKMKYYDKVTKSLLGQRDFVLSKAGDYYQDFNAWVGKGAITGFNGTTVWEADKPILVMQYAYSADWDNGSDFDPFMIVLSPQEQYIRSALVQTPINENFVNNFFSYIIEGDTSDAQQTKLKSLTIDGDTVYKSYSQLLKNNIPGTNYYWGRKTLSQGVHFVNSNTLFGGYVYGFGTFNSYGWPAPAGTKSLTNVDTLPPVLTFTKDCGDYTFHATELRNYGPSSADTVQIDQGIFDIFIENLVSYNYELKLITSDKIIPLPKITEFDFKLLVKDKTKDAFAVVKALDRVGNYAFDTVRFQAVKLPDMSPSAYLFKVPTADTTLNQTITITNSTQNTISIESLSLKTAKAFSITSGGISQKFDLAPAETYSIIIQYKPTTQNKGITELDSLSITYSGCGNPQQIISLAGKIITLAVSANPKALYIYTNVVDSAHLRTITITNPSEDTVHLRSVSLQQSTVFSVTSGNINSDVPLAPTAKHIIEVQYKPTSASVNKTELDTLHIRGLYASELRIPLLGILTAVGVDEGTHQSKFGMTTTPNPADENVLVTVFGNELQRNTVHLRLFDAIGRELTACSAEIEHGKSILLPNVGMLPIGAYRLLATSADGLFISTIMILIQR
ncbi:MAG: hypothetical protein JST20_00675 [Bacteroidetes bacterium]|nr:hypothetical protein [Bacteroidota bacterium]